MMEIASFLQSYLSEGFCDQCGEVLFSRIEKLASTGMFDGICVPNDYGGSKISSNYNPATPEKKYPTPANTSEYGKSITSSSTSTLTTNVDQRESPQSYSKLSNTSVGYGSVLRRGLGSNNPSPASSSTSSKRSGVSGEREISSAEDSDDLEEVERTGNDGHVLSREQREWIRFSQVRRKKKFLLMEKTKGRSINTLQGLELHAGVFSAKEQEKIVNCVYSYQKLGREGRLRERTYSEPKKWMRGKGRVTIQFGCCYNYAKDKDGNPPGIIRDEEVDPLPPLFKMMIKRMVRWHVLPPSCVPNSCIVNIYDEGDCIPPHIDHHDFIRPFCTISFLAECNILFGHNLDIVGPGQFSGPVAISLPVGSVFILNGNGADVAKHCVPGVPTKRISITFRKMDDAKLPYNFRPDPELQGIRPLQDKDRPQLPQVQVNSKPQQPQIQVSSKPLSMTHHNSEVTGYGSQECSLLGNDDFPPLTGNSNNRQLNATSRRSTRQ